jgi:hypothetical protein
MLVNPFTGKQSVKMKGFTLSGQMIGTTKCTSFYYGGKENVQSVKKSW